MTAESTPVFHDSNSVLELLESAGLPSGKTWLHKSIKDKTFPSGVKNYWADEVLTDYLENARRQSVENAGNVA